MSEPKYRRSPIAVASEWVSKITTVGLMMALPAGGGWWLDSKLGTSPGLLIAGAVLGFVASFRELLRITGSHTATLPPEKKGR